MGAGWWLRSTLSLLLAVGILAVALPAAFGSGAEGAGVNPVQVFSSGPLIAAESSGGGQLSIAGLVPGQSRSATIRVSNTGSAAAVFSVAAHLVDRVGSGGGRLSSAMTLRVQSAGSGRAPLYVGTLARMPRLTLGRIPAGTERALRFTVALPSKVGNEVAGSSLSAGFAWNAA
ncbi:MAG TPA: hypothetical protein VLK56_09760 [Solirubrobacterales bacterium]|nr:hypothetical protein [Solirubrobacterales bacterium]